MERVAKDAFCLALRCVKVLVLGSIAILSVLGLIKYFVAEEQEK
jgi:hypothetical protein